MKRYCLTQCAKDKLWVAKEVIVRIITFMVILTMLATAIVTLTFVLGLLVQGINVAIYGSITGVPIGVLDTGIASLIALVAIAVALFAAHLVAKVAFTIIKSIYNGIKKVTSVALRHDEFKCKIFEECTV